MDGLQAIKYSRGKLEVLDQLRLPHDFVYNEVKTCEEAFDTIRSMRVRGTVFFRLFLVANATRRKLILAQELRRLQLLPPWLWP